MKDEFLDLQAVDPIAARIKASCACETSLDATELAFAHRTLAVGCRDSGDLVGARDHLRSAMRFARQGADREVVADILATRGGTNIMFGSPRSGMRDLTAATKNATGVLLGRILYRRGLSHLILGNGFAGAEDGHAALELFQDHGDTVWLAKTLTLLGECATRTGNLEDAERRFAKARELLDENSGYEVLRLRMMEARLSFLRGDVPRALAGFRADELPTIVDGRLRGEAALRIATVYLAAGLAGEAADILREVDQRDIPTALIAELRALLARTLLMAGDAETAFELGMSASDALRRMGLSLEAAEAEFVAVEAQMLAGPTSDMPRWAEQVARDLSQTNSRLSADGWLIAGIASAGAGRRSSAARAYRRGSAHRDSSDLLVAASGWLARAHEVELSGQGGTLRACARGLQAIDDYREIMGSSEIRSAVTHLGGDLAKLALRNAAHDPRTLLSWSERWRATSLAQRPMTPQGELSPAVGMLRDRSRLIAEARAAGESTVELERERTALERRVRSEHHQLRTEGGPVNKRFNPAELVAQVGERAFVELVDVDGLLHVLVVSNGRVRRVIAGDTRSALELAEAGRFALRRAARTNRFAPGDLGQRLQEAVLGNAVRMLPDGPVTVSPTAALHGAPFALMPALVARPFSLVPSAAQWMRALAVPAPRAKRRVFVSGPGLVTGGAEVARLATEYPDATVLRGADATVAATMKAIDGAKLAHLATHGTFRADSPLFSALEMADGQLSVYELERLRRAPYRTILSACDSGVVAPVGAQEVLGLASALFSLGSAGLLCSIAEVNDEATADLMVRVHAALDAKRTPAEALAEVRAEGSPVEQATAAAFVALGV